ncbi:piggyBac transposable element-derived protein 4-like [Oncorhynchus tshawytscha]|uniref:piggyBac transposable element-derived protein 4-like n=1 Tax=Oncorhynchus tshawytscha TaxID=74940 RepID=UPI001C3DF981|nr:piggyBac transposable element-derived protein 4-like [Oncorhynchus tshawytscha]
MNFLQDILAKNQFASASRLKLGHKWIFQVTQVLCVEGSPFCALRSRVRATQTLCFQGSRSVLAGQSDRASHCRSALLGQSDPASRCTGPDVPRSVLESSRVLATVPATGEACASERSRESASVASVARLCRAPRSALCALSSVLCALGRRKRKRFRKTKTEEYNPERREVDDASSPSSEEEQPEEEPPEDEHEDEHEDRDEEEISSAPDRREPPLLSKTGKIEWSPVAYGRHRGPLAICHAGPDQTPGPTAYAATQARDIASAFHLFVTPAIERIIVEMTNLHGARKYGDGWRPMDATDLRAYLGLLILAGVYRSRGEAAASLWDAESGRTVFRATMSLKVFHRYSRLLRFDDRQSRPARLATDKLAAIRKVWDLWEARLPALYNPGPDVTVDEQLVPFRGRCPFRQYIPSKPAKYGIKSWVACDAKSSYAWKMQVYTGKAAGGGPEKNQGMRVVLDLTTGLSGRNVTCDNFFTSYDLGQRLLERNLTMVGTVRKNKAELPPALLESRGRQVLSSRFTFTPTATLVSYLAKRNKNVLLLSTLHTEGHISDRRDKKPDLILDYNCNKGGVDNLDKVVGTYSCRRMTARWPLVVFHNILDVSSYNAIVIWREIKPDWMPGKRNKCRVFLEQLGKALVKPLIQRRQHLPRTEAVSALVKVLQSATAAPPDQQRQGPAAGTAAAPLVAPATTGASKRKRCQLCPPKKDSKTHTVCCRCKKYICKGCSHAYCHTCAHWAFSQDGTG